MQIEEIRPSQVMKGAKKAYQEDVEFYLKNLHLFQSRNCPCCDRQDNEAFCRKEGFTYSKCRGCWTVFMNPGPTQELVLELYRNSHTYKYWGEHVYPKTSTSRFKNLTIPRAEYFGSAFEGKKLERLKILEIGAGTGEVIRYIKEKNPTVEAFALEPNPDMWPYYKEDEVKLVATSLESMKLKKSTFDCIMAFEVLEHLLDPAALLRNASLLLKQGGKLIFSTPNAASLEVGLMLHQSNTLDIEHISLVTPAGIHNMAMRFGLEVERLETPGKFDLELMQTNYRRKFFKIFFRGHYQEKFIQSEIARLGFSSHMKVILEKPKSSLG